MKLWRRRRSGPEDVRAELRRRCAPFLRDGERLHQVFAADTGLPPDMAWRVFLFSWLAFLSRSVRAYRLVCVTDRAVVVLAASRDWEPLGVLARCARNVRFGPMAGVWAPTDALGGRLYVHEMFHEDVAAADADLQVFTGQD